MMKKVIQIMSIFVISYMGLTNASIAGTNDIQVDDSHITGLTDSSEIPTITGVTHEVPDALKKPPLYASISELCQCIYSDIETIKSILFGKNGDKLERVLNNANMLVDYLKTNHIMVPNAINRLRTHIIKLAYAPMACSKQERFSSGVFGILGITGFLHTEENKIIATSDHVYHAYKNLASLFDTIESLHNFIEKADCRIKSNDAIISFMQKQMLWRTDMVINELEKTYQALEALEQM